MAERPRLEFKWRFVVGVYAVLILLGVLVVRFVMWLGGGLMAEVWREVLTAAIDHEGVEAQQARTFQQARLHASAADALRSALAQIERLEDARRAERRRKLAAQGAPDG